MFLYIIFYPIYINILKMYINQVDDLFDNILNKFSVFLLEKKAFKHLSSDTNFVKFQGDILNYIKKFIESLSKKDIINIIKNESYYDSVINIIKRYCAFYIYLGIAYHYKGNRDLFITNIIEASKNQKDATFQITNFFNSDNNSKIIIFYNDIKNFITLFELKTIDKIKTILTSNPNKYESTINLFNDLGEDYIIDFFLIQDNFHNIIKALIFRQIYLKEEKNEIIKMLNEEEKKNAEYKYIEIVVSNEKKIVDFGIIQKFLNIQQLKAGLAEEIYHYLEDFKHINEINIKENEDFIKYLFSNKILIPITEDFLRYHKDTEKYDPETLLEAGNIKEREATKIKYIIDKMNNVINYYSPLLANNPKQKIEIEKTFYKPLDPKMAVLYNNDEEVRIIKKLELSENATDFVLLADLENMRKYAYANFKHFSKDGIKIRIPNTIQGIRYTNMKYKETEQKMPLELRIGHSNIDMNVVGIAWNPTKMPLECFGIKDLVNVKSDVEDNGYSAFIKIMKKTFGKQQFLINDKTIDDDYKKIYYWLFDVTKDKPKFDSYINYNIDNNQHNIKLMISEIYKNYVKMIKYKLNNYISKIDEFSIWSLNNLIKKINDKYYNLELNPEIKNELIENVILNKIPELEIIDDDIDSLIPGKRAKLIELPDVGIKKKTTDIIQLGFKELEVSLETINRNLPVCQHYIKWRNIMKISKKTDDFNQAIFDFLKQYIKQNPRGDYICKSCNELVQVQKYTFEGTYVEELDTFLTTSLTVNLNLEEIPKYSKYKKTIKNIEKNIEKIAYTMDILAYIGNTPVIKLKRKKIIKDTIDLLLLHTEWLRKQPKDRIEQSSKKYGIHKDFTNLFFFELKDDIFLTSSQETDYYKIVKFNNVMTYLILLIIIELNPGQILSLRDDKRYNYFLFEKVKGALFDNIYIRINQKEKIAINKIPLLTYLLYYVSGMMITHRLWHYNDSNIEIKNKPIFLIGIQKNIINTVIDLLNSLVEANFETNKNFLYEIINTRITDKIIHIFNDLQLLKRLELASTKRIKFDENTKKIQFLTKKIDYIPLGMEFNIIDKNIPSCDVTTSELNINPIVSDINQIDILTNCPDGKFHTWSFKTNDLICTTCNKSYNELNKIVNTTSTEKPTNYLHKIKIINLKKLALKYCISGESHNLDNNNKCSLCGVNINNYNPSDKQLKELEKNIEIKTNETIIMQINKMKKYNEEQNKKEEENTQIINNFFKKYEKETNNKLEYYVISFIDKLINILGNKIKSNGQTIYLKETSYEIDHDYYGINKEPVIVLSSENKIQLIKDHPLFKKDILYYKDKANNIYVYYDSITYQYLGYSYDNKNIKKTKNVASLKVSLSIKDCIMYMGYENQYYNIYNINKKYLQKLPESLGNDTKNITLNIIRNRINNIKQIIISIQSLIYNIRNGGIVNTKYNTHEKQLVAEFIKKLKKFNISGESKNNIFKDYKYIINKLSINYDIPSNLDIKLNKNYLDINNLNSLNNTDQKLIYYIIYNLNKLLDYNKQNTIQVELANLIINLIKHLFNVYYIPNDNYSIRKFDYHLIIEPPEDIKKETDFYQGIAGADEIADLEAEDMQKGVGYYQELPTQEDVSTIDEKKEEIYNDKEAFDAFDIDDYGDDDDKGFDDIDYTAEALEGYEQ